jgi:serine protease Do
MKTHGLSTIGSSAPAWRIGMIMLVLAGLTAPTASAQGILKKLEERIKSKLPPAPRPPANESGYLGVIADSDDGGVKVADVTKGSPAQLAGLRSGDLIIGIGEQPVANIDDMAGILDGAAVGTRFGFRIRREGEEEVIHVTLGRKGAAPRPPAPVPEGSPEVAPPPIVSGPPRAQASLGVSLMPVTPELRAQHGIEVRRGAMIEKIRPGSAADQAGLPLHAVIVAAEGQRIDSPETLIGIIKTKRPGDELLISYYQGNQLLRKNLRLGITAPAPLATDPPLSDEEVIVPDAPSGRVPAEDGEVARLRQEVSDLRAEVDTLRKELAELKAALSGEKAPPPLDGAADDRSEEEPQLRRPAQPAEPEKETDA